MLIASGDFKHRRAVILRTKEPLASQHLPDHNTKRKNIASTIEVLTQLYLLGCEISRRAFDQPGLRHRPKRGLGDSEIDEFHRSVIEHDDVLRVDVPMNHFHRSARDRFGKLVYVMQGLTALARDVECELN